MMRRTIAVGIGLLALALLAMLPSTASAQYGPPPTVPPTVSPSSVVPPARPSTTLPTPSSVPPSRPQDTRPPEVQPGEVVNPQPQPQAPTPKPEVKGDVVSRPLPRTGNDIGGTAIFGGALTVLGVALALGARKRRNSFDGA